MTDPVADASALIQPVFALLLEARQTRERLTAMEATGAAEAERIVYLGLISACEAGLRRTLEEALATMKGINSGAAEAWLRKQMEGLK